MYNPRSKEQLGEIRRSIIVEESKTSLGGYRGVLPGTAVESQKSTNRHKSQKGKSLTLLFPSETTPFHRTVGYRSTSTPCRLHRTHKSRKILGTRSKYCIMVTPIHISILLLVLYPVLVVGKKSKPQCDLYMAESTIPNAGLGIFTSISKEKGETVGNGDICLPFIDIHWHNDDGFFYPFADYVWDGKFMGMNQEVGTYDVEAYWPGLDCAVNCNLALLNVVKAVPEYDEAGTHRTEHPGAGAFTPYHKGTTEVRRSIPPGGELFKFYGDNWYVPNLFYPIAMQMCVSLC
jgi:hypothetical protein